MAKLPTDGVSEKPAKRKGGRKPVDPNELPADRFRRMASLRVSNLLDCIRLTRQCFVTGTYEWTPEQAENIIKAIELEAGVLVHAARHPSGSSGKRRQLFDI